MNLEQVRELLRRQCAEAGGQRAWATRHGISDGYVSHCLHNRRLPGPEILRALGLVAVTTFEKVDGRDAQA